MKVEIDLVNKPAEVNAVVLKKKKRRRKRCKGMAVNALVLQNANQADKMEEDLEFGKNGQLQDTVMDVDITTRLFEENPKTDLDSGTNSSANSKARKKRKKRANKNAGGNSGSQCKDNGDIISSPNLAESADSKIVSMTPAAQGVEAANHLFRVPFQVPENPKTDLDSGTNSSANSKARKKRKKRANKKAGGNSGSQCKDNGDIISSPNLAESADSKIVPMTPAAQGVEAANHLFRVPFQVPENPKTDLDSGTNSGANSKARKKRKKRANKKAGGNSGSQCKDNGDIISSPNLAESADSKIVSMTPAAQGVEAANHLFRVPFQVPKRVRKKLLILDLNGLLADIVLPPPPDCKSDINISGRAIFKRPFYYDFLKFCFERFNVGVWSSRSKRIVDRVVDYLFGHLKHKLLFCWHMLHCTQTCFRTLENRYKPLVFKELRKLWEKHDAKLPWKKGDYDESNTLLVDDSPYKALLNPINTALFPFTHCYKDVGDTSLGVGGDLRVYLEGLAKAENVQTYIGQNPFGQNAINEQSPFWSFYSKVLNNVSAASKQT